MRKTTNHIKDKLCSHKLFFAVLAFVILAVFSSLVLFSNLLHENIGGYFHQIYEKKSIGQLAMHHRGWQLLFEADFERKIESVKRLALERDLQEAYQADDMGRIQNILDRQHSMSQSFEDDILLDENGVLRVVSSEFPDMQQFVGRNMMDRPQIREAFEKREPLIMHVPMTLSGRNKIFFVAPSVDASGEVQYLVAGAISLHGLARRLEWSAPIDEFETLFLDEYGEILLKNQQYPDERISVAGDDRLVQNLLRERREIQDEEINYEAKRVFAIGAPLRLGTTRPFYLVTSYSVAQFEEEVAQLNKELEDAFELFTFFVAAVILGFSLILGLLIHRYDQIHHIH